MRHQVKLIAVFTALWCRMCWPIEADEPSDTVSKSEVSIVAKFAFVEGTDPEVLLLIEPIPDDSDPGWRFGFARTNRDAIRITYRDVEVWTAPHIEQWDGRFQEPYAIYAMRNPLPSVP